MCVCRFKPSVYRKELSIARRKEKRNHEMFQSPHCAVWVERGFGLGLVKVLMFIV